MTAKRPRRVAGFFSTAWLFRSKVVFAWDFVIAGAFGIIAGQFPTSQHLQPLAVSLSGAAFALAPALVGVVVAALAVVVALLDDEFLELVDRATERHGRIEGQLFPFWFVTATGVGALLSAVLSNIVFGSLIEIAQRLLLAILAFLIVGTAVGVFNLVGYLTYLGVSRTLFVRSRLAKLGSKRR